MQSGAGRDCAKATFCASAPGVASTIIARPGRSQAGKLAGIASILGRGRWSARPVRPRLTCGPARLSEQVPHRDHPETLAEFDGLVTVAGEHRCAAVRSPVEKRPQAGTISRGR